MYRSYKIVVNTAAGRRRYMQYLVPFIVSSEIVDRYDIWVNTCNGADIEFFRLLAEKYSKINLVWQPDGVVNGISSINAFYHRCIESNTIYFKLDDDIIWMESDAIKKMIDFRIDNPRYFLVSPLVINNALSTYLLEICGKIQLDAYYNSSASHNVLWKSGDFASQLHKWFIEKFLLTDRIAELHLGVHDMAMTRFSINAILWFGDEMKKFNGIVPGDDEEFLSCIYPTRCGLSNCWNGDTLMAHFAFFTQREELDAQNILQIYGDYLHRIWLNDAVLGELDKDIQSMMEYIKMDEERLMNEGSPYPPPPSKSVHKRSLKAQIGSWLNINLPTVYAFIKSFKSTPKNYILK